MSRTTISSATIEGDHAVRLVLAAAISAFLLTACAEVKTELTKAALNIDEFLGVERDHDTNSIRADVEAIYREGLALKGEARHQEAADRFYRAASLDHAAAAYEMGLAYNEGRGVTKDLEQGAHWFNVAADGGDVRAQFVVGATLYAEAGGAGDYDRAIEYLMGAANQGHSRAQFVLGEAYANGRGVPMDITWSARWYGKAAAQGHARAQFAIGVFRSTGLGVPKDVAAAYAWLSLAAAGGHEDAANVRDTVARRLAAAVIERADARVAAFRPRRSPAFADEPTVVYVQQALNALGHVVGSADGAVGTRTRTAIADYRAKAGLPADGEITPALVERLFADSHGGS